MKVHCAHDQLVPISELRSHPKNRNKHPPKQITRLAKVLEYQGFRYPVKVSRLSGYVTSGHGRIEAARKNGWTEVPVNYQDYESEEQEYADVQADNAIASWAELDLSGINDDLKDLGPDFDIDLLGIENFKLDAEGDGGGDSLSLSERFGVPPFSVLDARQGYWQDRKRTWIGLGLKSERGREVTGKALHARQGQTVRAESTQKIIDAGAEAASVFDPVLCELVYRWFSPKGGTVLDPFAGGSVRGVIASRVGRQYVGVDLRAEQVEENREQASALCSDPVPAWACGDSRDIAVHAAGVAADLVFSCPPYGDLEVYSDDPKDLSTLGYKEFREAYFEIIARTCALLRDDRFACFVVGDFRDRKGIYQNFVSDTIEAFLRAGLKLYNEAILVTAVGSTSLRAGKQFSVSRKLGKCHQNVLVFVKGDPRRATEACGEVEVELPEETSGDVGVGQ
jgi:hypothetical protein